MTSVSTQSLITASSNGLTAEEQEQIDILRDVVKWAYVYFGWTAYDYQMPILKNLIHDAQAVFRLGRRLGKTEIMCIMILWYGFTQYNKKEVTNVTEDQYDILIVAPFEKQIDLIFKRLKQLIESSPVFQDSIEKDIKHNIKLKNKTNILGITAGSKAGNGAAGTRGQRADVIIFDEVDYMTDDDITNIRNIKNEDPTRIRIIAASTPSGKRESYYKWCSYASKSFLADTDYIEKTGKVRYRVTTAKGSGYKPNGWTQYYAPSLVNKKLQEMNPDTGQSYLEDLKDEFPEYRYAQEVMAEFGEELAGVYQKRFIDGAIALGNKYKVSYANLIPRPKRGPRILGVDWDKVGAETSLLAYEWDTQYQMFMPLDKVSIPRTKFTLTIAVDTIIKLNKIHDFDWIYVDKGYGEMQIEQLHLYGKNHPETGMHKKVVGVSFSEKVDVRDPYTKKKDSKDVKPFMVYSSVNLFEKGMVALNPADMQIKEQLEGYRYKSVSPNGRPIFSDDNEHYVDAMNLCMLGFSLQYDSMIRVQLAKKIATFSSLDRELSETNTSAGAKLTDEQSRNFLDTIENTNKLKSDATRSIGIKSLGRNSRSARGVSKSGFVSRTKF